MSRPALFGEPMTSTERNRRRRERLREERGPEPQTMRAARKLIASLRERLAKAEARIARLEKRIKAKR